MVEELEKYGLVFEDLTAYADGSLDKDKCKLVEKAINENEEIKEICIGFSNMKDDFPEGQLVTGLNEKWKGFVSEVEAENRKEESTKPRKKRIVPLVFWSGAATFAILIGISLFFNSTQDPNELAISFMTDDIPSPLIMRDTPETQSWAKVFQEGKYEDMILYETDTTEESEELLFFLGLSNLLMEEANREKAIIFFDRVLNNNLDYYDKEALYYSGLTLIQQKNYPRATDRLEKCNWQEKQNQIDQLLRALR